MFIPVYAISLYHHWQSQPERVRRVLREAFAGELP
jgi:hypothetical protein